MRAPLKHRAPLFGCLLAAACAQIPAPNPSPTDRFYFPSSLAFFLPSVGLPDGGASSGVLYVASANYDRRYDQGNLLAVNLDRVQAPPQAGFPNGLYGLPPPATPTGDLTSPLTFTTLNTADGDVVQIASFAGEMLRDPIGWEGDGRPRLWLPTRAEGDFLEVVSTDPTTGEGLTCVPCANCAPNLTNNCIKGGLTVALEQDPQHGTGLPAAPEPYGIGMSPEDAGPGQIWLSHIRSADSPPTSGLNLENYAVRLKGRTQRPSLSNVVCDVTANEIDGCFTSVAVGGGNSLAVGTANVFMSGRVSQSSLFPDILMRIIQRDPVLCPLDSNGNPFCAVFPQVRQQYPNLAARGLAMRPDQTRIYLVALQPDTLLVLDVTNPDGTSPTLTVVRAVPLPAGPNEIRLMERPKVNNVSSDVLAITCQDDGSVAFYDDEIGQLGIIVSGVGLAPYDLAVDQRGGVARLFASNFADGRVAVIDTALGGNGRPITARLVATLGEQQGCIIQTNDSTCVGSQ
jgi:hypothetical protein